MKIQSCTQLRLIATVIVLYINISLTGEPVHLSRVQPLIVLLTNPSEAHWAVPFGQTGAEGIQQEGIYEDVQNHL